MAVQVRLPSRPLKRPKPQLFPKPNPPAPITPSSAGPPTRVLLPQPTRPAPPIPTKNLSRFMLSGKLILIQLPTMPTVARVLQPLRPQQQGDLSNSLQLNLRARATPSLAGLKIKQPLLPSTKFRINMLVLAMSHYSRSGKKFKNLPLKL